MSRVFFVFVCVIAAGLADTAPQLNCPGTTTQCAVSNVDVTPCAKPDRCAFKLGKTASIRFDFVPEFDATELEHDVSTEVAGVVQSFQGLDKDACKFTACPVSAGNKKTFSYNLHLDRRNVVKGKFDIKWTLWNKAQKEQMCCFVTKIWIK